MMRPLSGAPSALADWPVGTHAIFVLPSVPASVTLARRLSTVAIHFTLAAGHPAGHLDVDVLTTVVSELVTNAVQHGPGASEADPSKPPQVVMGVATRDRGVEIVVGQATAAEAVSAALPMPGWASESGRGLAIVADLTGQPPRIEQIDGELWVSALVPWRTS